MNIQGSVCCPGVSAKDCVKVWKDCAKGWKDCDKDGFTETVLQKRGSIMGEKLTKGDVAKIEAELEHRKVVIRKQAAREIAEAAAQGDRSENFEYYAAKKFRGENESRIRYLERVLKTAVIVSDESKDDEVGMNNSVVVFDRDMQEEETLRIVTSIRGDILKGQISIESPIGKALLGHKVGDVVTVNVDNGYSYQMEIRKIIKENDESADRIRSF